MGPELGPIVRSLEVSFGNFLARFTGLYGEYELEECSRAYRCSVESSGLCPGSSLATFGFILDLG